MIALDSLWLKSFNRIQFIIWSQFSPSPCNRVVVLIYLQLFHFNLFIALIAFLSFHNLKKECENVLFEKTHEMALTTSIWRRSISGAVKLKLCLNAYDVISRNCAISVKRCKKKSFSHESGGGKSKTNTQSAYMHDNTLCESITNLTLDPTVPSQKPAM